LFDIDSGPALGGAWSGCGTSDLVMVIAGMHGAVCSPGELKMDQEGQRLQVKKAKEKKKQRETKQGNTRLRNLWNQILIDLDSGVYIIFLTH
jgi:hypothetical protein